MIHRQRVLLAVAITVVGVAVMAVVVVDTADQPAPDVCIEVDTTTATTVDPAQFRQVEQAFATAPVVNRTTLEYRLNDTAIPAVSPANFSHYYRTHTDDRDYDACAYMLITDNTTDPIAGATAEEFALINRDPVVNETHTLLAHIVMHETGHLLGIGRQYEGVDTRGYAVGEYYSVMNYNATYRILTYSNGSDQVGRNEWQLIYEQAARNETPTPARPD